MFNHLLEGNTISTLLVGFSNPLPLIAFSIVLPLSVVVYYYLIQLSKRRKAISVVKTKPRRLRSFVTKNTPEKVIEEVIQFAKGADYTIEDIDEDMGRVILSSSFNHFSWGFFFPVYVSRQNDGSTLTEVGIQSRLYQIGPIVTLNHKRIFNNIRKMILKE